MAGLVQVEPGPDASGRLAPPQHAEFLLPTAKRNDSRQVIFENRNPCYSFPSTGFSGASAREAPGDEEKEQCIWGDRSPQDVANTT
jgi:hypothetical protein